MTGKRTLSSEEWAEAGKKGQTVDTTRQEGAQKKVIILVFHLHCTPRPFEHPRDTAFYRTWGELDKDKKKNVQKTDRSFVSTYGICHFFHRRKETHSTGNLRIELRYCPTPRHFVNLVSATNTPYTWWHTTRIANIKGLWRSIYVTLNIIIG